MNNNTSYINDQFRDLQVTDSSSRLAAVRQEAMQDFSELGIPSVRHEEWKYTRISGLFNKEFQLAGKATSALTSAELEGVRLPGHDLATELFFINGVFTPHLSVVRSSSLAIMLLDEAANHADYKAKVEAHFNHSAQYLKDGINALNTAYMQGGLFLHIPDKKIVEGPVYIYNITDARSNAVLSQPRSLIYVGKQAEVKFVETYVTIGETASLTNQVLEIVIEEAANVGYYKLQNDASHASQVSTTHFRQIGKSVFTSVTLSLNGAIVRNNLHAVMEASYSEAHLYGLYFQRGMSHIDNHTIVDNAVPHCESNELYKGILDGQSTGVFNGKIFVRKDAQKTNAFQSNKNVLLTDTASVNTKPQLEIFADDVKCSHGCTVGALDSDALFYLQARGIPKQEALALLLQGFAMDILEKIELEPIRTYVETLITQRLTGE